VSEEQAIASTLYFRNSEAAKRLAQLTLQESLSNPSTTDMHILRKLYELESINVQILPSAPVNSAAFLCASVEMRAIFSQAVDYFGGVFDGFDLGQYLLGIDPRNMRGRSVVRSVNHSHHLNCRELEFSMSAERNFPNIYDTGSMKPIPLYSLHVHSKNLKLFQDKSCSSVLRKSVKASPLKEATIFYPKVFVKSVFLALNRRVRKFRVGSYE
jgi:hypothetical protein